MIDINQGGDWFQDMEVSDSGSRDNNNMLVNRLQVLDVQWYVSWKKWMINKSRGNVAIHKLPKAVSEVEV